MYSSLAFRPSWPAATWPRITLAAGLAVRAGLAALTPTTPDLKWPNDLVVGGNKLGGILTEAEGDLVMVGCGVNLWWPEPPPGVVAACPDDPGAGLGRALAETWATALLDSLGGGPQQWGASAYRNACATLGAEITWEPEGKGTAIDVDESGRLIVETATGTVALGSGEVRSVRGATVALDGTDERGGTAG